MSGFQIKSQKKLENFYKPFDKSSQAFSSLPKRLLNVMRFKVFSRPLIEKPKVISNTLLLSDYTFQFNHFHTFYFFICLTFVIRMFLFQVNGLENQ